MFRPETGTQNDTAVEVCFPSDMSEAIQAPGIGVMVKTTRPRIFYFQIILGIVIASNSTLLLGRFVYAQTAADRNHGSSEPRYDVVSIRQSNAENLSVGGGKDNWDAKAISIKMLLANAYGVRTELITGIPANLDSKLFDIHAKMLGGGRDLTTISRSQQQEMLRQILRERFNLKAHQSSKILSTYDLAQSRNGAKMHEIKQTSSQDPALGSMSIGNGELTGHGMSMESLAYSLTGIVQRDVIDKTGLHGIYEIHLKWDNKLDTFSDDGRIGDQSSAPSIFTAIQEELGLKLQSAKDPIPTLVVDHVEFPSAN